MKRETEAYIIWKEREEIAKTYEYFGLDGGQPPYAVGGVKNDSI